VVQLRSSFQPPKYCPPQDLYGGTPIAEDYELQVVSPNKVAS
jgi:hypothetical protein